MKTLPVLFMILALAVLSSRADTSVLESRKYSDSILGLTVVSGTLELPGGGGWTVIQPRQDAPLSQVQLALSSQGREGLRGIRAQKVEIQRQIEQEQYPLRTLHSLAEQYARTNNGIGPDKWGDINSNSVRYLPPNLATLETNFFLVPAVYFPTSGIPERKLLAVQLHPLMADGKHWLLYNNGQSERVPIDPTLCAKYGIVVQPQRSPEVEPAEPVDLRSPRWAISALVRPGVEDRATLLSVSNQDTGAHLDVAWDIGQAGVGDRSVLSGWAKARGLRWATYASNGDAPVLQYWLSRCDSLYGAGLSDFLNRDGRNRGEMTDAFSVLGGRAAVRETLQMQPLRGGGSVPGGTPHSIAISTLTGVGVQSHPFDEMLKSVKPGALSLAENVPADRAFVYFPKPETLLPLLNGGADFIFQGGSLALGNPAAYDLKNRYVDRLALSDQWVRDLLLKSGAVKEMAVLFPDLFFIDGTEVTVLARIPSARLLTPALSALGFSGLTEGIQEKSVPAGKSFWTLNGDLLIISTSRSEVDRIVALRNAGGVGSLGRSAEFRYMLAQMPLRPETRFFCYLSDPFIRRLVGPEVKIGQLRRLRAKGEMENVSAAALLYRLDHPATRPDLATLISKGYLAAEPSAASGCTLDEHLVASCPAYGSPAHLKTLLENPVATVTPVEAEAYKSYVENYSRFWRQYFDPMAFRLDDGPDGELHLATFILPLIDNTLYNGLKGALCRREDGTPLRLLDLSPKPLLLLSANLSEDSWTKVTKDMFSELLRQYTTLDPAAFDKIGPGVHLAIHDADPILTFGAGDALGIFSAPMTMGGRNSEMLFIPVLASILTRPCQLIVELQDPEAMLRMMRAASTAPLGRERHRDLLASFYKVEGRDAWVCTMSIANIVKVRFGVEIRDRFLILSNLPWSQKPNFGPMREAPLNALALDLHPEAGVLQVPGLFTAACEQERAESVQGERYLYPLLASGAGSVAGATEQCRMLFGFVPEHPGRGRWVWENGQVRSTIYGDANHPLQPEYKPGDRVFGLLGGLDALNLNLQFEDVGLRVITRWKMKE